MKRYTGPTLLLALGAVLIATLSLPADAGMGNESVNYSYDALGRLTGSSITGGPNDTRKTGACFDRAGNRMRYDIANSTISTCPTPTPAP